MPVAVDCLRTTNFVAYIAVLACVDIMAVICVWKCLFTILYEFISPLHLEYISSPYYLAAYMHYAFHINEGEFTVK
jgi:hypothetical protein